MNCRPAARAALICAAYLAVAIFAESIARSVPADPLTGFCQMPGLSLGLLVLCGLRYTPAVFAAQIFAALPFAHGPAGAGPAVAIAAAATVIFALSAWLVRRKFGPAPVPANVNEATALAAVAAAVPLATSLVATALAWIMRLPDAGPVLSLLLARWSGGVAGVLTAVPVIAVHVAPWVLPGRRRPSRPATAGRRLESAAQTAALLLAILLVNLPTPLHTLHSFFICFVPLVWIGLRRGLAGTTLAALVVNFGNVLILRTTGAPDALLAHFALFEIAFAAVGLGLGAAVDFREEAAQAAADKNRLLEIVEASCDFIGSADLELRVLYLNPAFLRLRGLPDLASARERPISDFHPAWAVRKVIEEALPSVLEHDTWIGETALLDAEGREIPVSQLILVQRDEARRPVSFSTIARDISRQKELERVRLANERTMLQAQKMESLGVLAGGIAHDFNNLLTVVLGNVSLAQLDLATDTPAFGYLQQSRTAVVRATELCRQMLAYAGKGQFSAVLVNLSALVEDTAQLLKVSISKKCVLQFDLARDLPQVRVDATQIRQIVMNLVINASDAIGERSGLIHISTSLMRASAAYLADVSGGPGVKPGDYVALEIADNGCGMTPEIKARVFEPFFTTKFAGRGLGLAAVLGIVRSHGGALKVVSEPGRGSTFTLLLPAERGAAEGPPAGAVPRAGLAGPDRGSILVVDDENTVRVVAARLLESQGYTAVLAADGREAVQLFKEHASEFSAVLLDLTMPHMNGEETFRELRRVRHDVPVVLMSGFSERDSLGRFPARDLAAFIPKPFDREVLIARIREAVGKHAG